jgi:F-type H+-transporting ATPase subunit b
MQELLNTLGIKGPVILLQIVGFGVLYLLLRRFLFGPVGAMLEARRQEVEAGLKASEESRAEAGRLAQNREEILARARDEGRSLVQKAVKEAQEARERILSEAQTERQQILERGREMIDLERRQAVVNLREEVSELALRAASRAIREAMDEKAHRQAIETFISSLEAEAGDS